MRSVAACCLVATFGLAAFLLTTSCGGSNSNSTSSELGVLIGADLGSSNNVHVLAIDSDGTVAAVPGSPFAAAGSPVAVAASASSHLVFVGCGTGGISGAVSAFEISSSGTLTPLGAPTTSNVFLPSTLSLTPNSDFLVVSGDNGPAIFSVDDSTGALTYISDMGPYGPTTLSPNGQFIFYVDGSYLDVYAFNDTTGAASFVSSSFQFFGAVATPPVVAPSGQFVYVPYSQQGGNGGIPGGIAAFSVGADGTLNLIPGSPFASGIDFESAAGTPLTAAVISPSGKYLYAIGASGAYAFSIDQTSGALTTISSTGPFLGGGFYTTAMDPFGQYLFLSESQGRLWSFSVGSNGVPTQVSGSPFSVGNEITSLASIQP